MSRQLVYVKVLCVLCFSMALCSNVLEAPPTYDYRGGVVQYYPQKIEFLNNSTLIDSNIKYYEMFITAAKRLNIEILVFPEYGLTTISNYSHFMDAHFASAKYRGSDLREYNTHLAIEERRKTGGAHVFHKNTPLALQLRARYRDIASAVPDPKDRVVPCENEGKYKKSLRIISCTAQSQRMYVVINHYEISECKPEKDGVCPEDGFFLYNTNVAFDRDGAVIARYRKHNLMYEPWADGLASPQLSTFATDFNVTFAQLIGADIMSKRVTDLIVDDPDVTGVVYSTHQFDRIPFLSSVQDRATFAFETNLDLLASGFSKDGTSEVYLGRKGVYQKYIKKDFNNMLVFADIRKDKAKSFTCPRTKDNHTIASNQAEINAFMTVPVAYDLVDDHEDLSSYFEPELIKTELLDPSTTLYDEQLCVADFCCRFTVDLEFNGSYVDDQDYVYYRYRAMVAKGLYLVGEDSLAETEVCALIGCTSDRLADCGRTFLETERLAPTSFRSLLIARHLVPDADSFFGPMALANTEILAPELDYSYRARGSNGSKLLILDLARSTSNIEFFGLNARRLNVDAWRLAWGRGREEKTKKHAIFASRLAIVVATLLSVVALVVVAVSVAYKLDFWGRCRSVEPDRRSFFDRAESANARNSTTRF